MITVILNSYKRQRYLSGQIEAIRAQSISAEEIWIWQNKPEGERLIPMSPPQECKVIASSHNFKFHGRFALGLLAQTEYVAFFDDDTFPGPRWFQNCLDTISSGFDGILGTSGVLLTGSTYRGNAKVGWNGLKNTAPLQVDLVGHAWFLKKDYLRYLWYEEPITWDNGEDLQLSYLAQKYGGVKTFVPPHDSGKEDEWGSQPRIALKLGNDDKASWRSADHSEIRDEIVRVQIERGWKTVRGHQNSSAK